MFHRPSDLSDALQILERGGCTPLSGGTDVFPGLVDRPPVSLLDLSGIAALRGVTCAPAHTRIGAGTTWAQIVAADLPPCFEMLKQAARAVGSVQIQNRATIGGNLCNASPAADGVPPLLALDAQVELTSPSGRRVLPLERFLQGNRATARAADELLTAILIPHGLENAGSAFVKLGARRYLVISVVMVAAVVEIEAATIRAARVAIGAASAVAQRLRALEARLIGRDASSDFASLINADDLAALTPIDDLRASAAYRLDAGRELIARALQQAAHA